MSPDGSVVRNSAAAAIGALSIHLVAAACLVVPVTARSAGSATGDCATLAGAFRERLESVTGAAIDGRSAQVPVAADRALPGWHAHGSSLGEHASADSVLAQRVSVARAHDANAAAHMAVARSTASPGWCGGALSITDQLMVLDLTGMAAWIRARNIATDQPANSRAVSESVAVALLDAHRTEPAARLRTAYAAVEPRGSGKAADATAAIRLLGLVDDLE